jgi:hypothetical protein
MPALKSNCPNCNHHFDDYEYHLQACGCCGYPDHEDEEEPEFDIKDEFGLEEYYPGDDE